MIPIRTAVSAALLALAGAAIACTAESGTQRVPLLELYTSEGCNSCPPADRWFGTLAARGLAPQRVLALAFHVDYWNHLGWKDSFARSAFSERQWDAAQRNRARFVYTPQFLLDGRDYRRGRLRDDITERLAATGSRMADAMIRASITGEDGQQKLRVEIDRIEPLRRRTAQTYWAIYENRLSSRVTAGENRGKRLEHEAVVRHLAGPFSPGPAGTLDIEQPLRRNHDWKIGNLHLAVFVQNADNGETLQSLSLPWCMPHS